MLAIVSFWFIVQLFALAALPLAWRLFRALPERGYVLAKPLGLLLVSYVFWMGASVGLLRNSAGGILFAWLLVAALSVWLGREGLRRAEGDRSVPLLRWLRANWRLVLTTELLFAVALFVWAFVRSYDPGISSTEKPMEFAFLNGILRSESFPPLDPWLSGYAISYYYFGYVMMALLTRLSGAPSGVGFIASSAMWFALTVTAAFGVAYDLAAQGSEGSEETSPIRPLSSLRHLFFGLLGSLFVAVLGNLEGLFELLHAKGIGSEAFYRWLDVKNLASAPLSNTWYPGDNWWWWRASRVIHDKTLAGASQEVIDEFPFFSFLLGDMHPHVLALPFVLLAIGLALNLLFSSREPLITDHGSRITDRQSLISNIQSLILDVWHNLTNTFPLGRTGLLLYALCLGALGFLNTWDVLPYLFLIMLAYGVARAWPRGGVDGRVIGETIGVGALLGLLGIVLYLPFYLSFSSQAGQDGWVWPNLYNPTRLVQFFLMFGTFLVAVLLLLGLATVRLGTKRVLRDALRWLPWTVLLPALLLLLIVLLAQILPQGRAFVERLLSLPAVQADVGGAGLREVLQQIGLRRLTMPGTYLLLAVSLAWVLGLLAQLGRPADEEGKAAAMRLSPPLAFVLLMLVTAFLLTFGVEFAFLKDTFSTRMNTVFKFYYQAWLLLALAAAYAVSEISRSRGAVRPVGLTLVTLLVLAGMVYPLMAAYSKSNRFAGERTLDGFAYVEQYAPDEAAAIAWLRAMEPTGAAVLLEAPGGSFRAEQSRVSSATGLPTLVGWTGHELQWRGSGDEVARREPVIEKIYRNAPVAEIPPLLREWDITYVFVGPAEVAKYNLTPQLLARFDRTMDKVFEQGQVRIYRRR